jgi:hypothetical protein
LIATATLILMQSVILLLIDRNIVSGMAMLESIDAVCSSWERMTAETNAGMTNRATIIVRNFTDGLKSMMTN